MALTVNERQALINDLTTNCECWSAQGDEEVLNSFSDDKLLHLKETADREQQVLVVANMAVRGFDDGKGSAYRLNPDTGSWETKPVGNAKKAVRDDEDEDEEEDDEEEEEYIPPRRRAANNARSGKGNADRQRAQTIDELLRNAAPGLRDQVENTLRSAQVLEEREKDKIITRLMVNIAEPDRPARREWLHGQPLNQLEQMLSLVPSSPEPEEVARAARQTTNGWPGGVSGFAGNALPDDDVLPLPKDAWKPVGDSPDPVNNGQRQSLNGGSVQDYIRSAPPELQALLRNAAAVESQQRDELINQLTENVSDEEDAERLSRTLRDKPVHELKVLLALTSDNRSRAPTPRPGSYAPSPPLTNLRPASGDQDDVLPLPKWDYGKGGENGGGTRRRQG